MKSTNLARVPRKKKKKTRKKRRERGKKKKRLKSGRHIVCLKRSYSKNEKKIVGSYIAFLFSKIAGAPKWLQLLLYPLSAVRLNTSVRTVDRERERSVFTFSGKVRTDADTRAGR